MLARLILSVFFVLALFSSFAAAIDKEAGWEEYLKAEYGIYAAWCGQTDAIVIKTLNYQDGTGGILYIDVPKKKRVWITKDPFAKSPFCSHDGKIVFMAVKKWGTFYFPGSDKPDEGPLPDGMEAYEVATGRRWKYSSSDVHTDFMQSPASPAEKIYAVVGYGDKSEWTFDLPGWKVLMFPKDGREVHGIQWSSDGRYILMRDYSMDFPRSHERPWAIYDRDGRYILSKDIGDLKEPYGGIAKKEGVYLNDEKGMLYLMDPFTGVIKEVGFQLKGTDYPARFDIFRNGDIAYVISDRDLWMSNLRGGKRWKLSNNGSSPLFSPGGEYLAFNRGVYGERVDLVVLRRKKNK